MYNLHMNPLKCAFKVTVGKFLGFLVHRLDIDPNEGKIKIICNMPELRSEKQVKSFLGKMPYLGQFILALS